jgi:elongation factor P
VSDKVEEADIENRTAMFIYERNGEWFFHESKDKSKRFTLDADHIGDDAKWLKANMEVDVKWFEEKPIQIKIPIKVELKVVEAPPNTRGNTAQGGNKPVKLETGATITVPMFVEAGDVIRINTETGDYVERV